MDYRSKITSFSSGYLFSAYAPSHTPSAVTLSSLTSHNHLCLSFRSLLEGDEYFQVPEVIDELSGRRVLAMELVQGVPLDSCVDLDQETRNQVWDCSPGEHMDSICAGMFSVLLKYDWCTRDWDNRGIWLNLQEFEALKKILQMHKYFRIFFRALTPVSTKVQEL